MWTYPGNLVRFELSKSNHQGRGGKGEGSNATTMAEAKRKREDTDGERKRLRLHIPPVEEVAAKVEAWLAAGAAAPKGPEGELTAPETVFREPDHVPEGKPLEMECCYHLADVVPDTVEYVVAMIVRPDGTLRVNMPGHVHAISAKVDRERGISGLFEELRDDCYPHLDEPAARAVIVLLPEAPRWVVAARGSSGYYPFSLLAKSGNGAATKRMKELDEKLAHRDEVIPIELKVAAVIGELARTKQPEDWPDDEPEYGIEMADRRFRGQKQVAIAFTDVQQLLAAGDVRLMKIPRRHKFATEEERAAYLSKRYALRRAARTEADK